MPLLFKMVYDDRYDLNLGAHVFPSQKYRLIHRTAYSRTASRRRLIFLLRRPASDEDVLRVHTRNTFTN